MAESLSQRKYTAGISLGLGLKSVELQELKDIVVYEIYSA